MPLAALREVGGDEGAPPPLQRAASRPRDLVSVATADGAAVNFNFAAAAVVAAATASVFVVALAPWRRFSRASCRCHDFARTGDAGMRRGPGGGAVAAASNAS
jgi:hypothetical protein